MKKIIYTLLFALLVPSWLMAQERIAEIWTKPAVFKADEQVSVFFDVTGTLLDGISETEGVRVWTWFPNNPDDNWSSPSDKTKLKHVEGNIWRWDLVPTEFYNLPADQITAFYGQLQNYAGNKITQAFASDKGNAITVYSLNTISAATAVLDFYPKQFTVNRPLSVLVNTNNTWSDCETTAAKGKLAKATNMHVHAGVNDWATVIDNNAANVNKTKLTDMSNGIYRWDIILNDYFALPEGFKLTGINMVFANADWSLMGKDVECADFFIAAPIIPNVVIPTLSFFPQKISQKDILCIFRQNNEAYVSKLSYTITAGTKTLTGDFEGTTKEMIAYVNLVDLLKDAGVLEKIHVLLKDNSGRTVSENDLPFVQLND